MISYMKTAEDSEIVSPDEYKKISRAAWSKETHELSERLNLEFDVRNQRIELAKAVKTRRSELNLTQRALAKMIGVSTRDICHIETAKANPTLSTQVKLLSTLGLKLEITTQ